MFIYTVLNGMSSPLVSAQGGMSQANRGRLSLGSGISPDFAKRGVPLSSSFWLDDSKSSIKFML